MPLYLDMESKSSTHLALCFRKQSLSNLGALCVVPASIQALDDLHLFSKLIISCLHQHRAEPPKIIRSGKPVQVEIQESTEQ
jgi:hypothetical protein